ncbi:MAG: insulinase family protein [Bacteroidales bacterium]|nr:insulinase family protein [Bacteroidales bacterium]
MRRILFAALAVILGFSAVAQQAQPLPCDPAVKKGQLENGLTYYIRHNDLPAARAEFYLATDVGAIQETPDQDGLAHFLEHMCFNGTKNFPGKGILDWLQSIGASFGGNVNASTGFEHTQYMLNNIPLVRPTVVDTCLLIMHDYSHFVTNDPSEIDAERGVIIEERRSRRNANWRMFEKSLPYYYGDSKFAGCTLIGSQENLETFKPESLWNFYKTWYRPDLQALIVVGDIDVDEVEQKIKTIFADIPAAENPQPKELYPIPGNQEPLVGIITDPEATIPNFEVLWKGEALPKEMNSTIVGEMMDVVKDLISMVMDERFKDITSVAEPPFLAGNFDIDKYTQTMEAAEGTVSCKEDAILPGFKAFMTELEKLKRYGFTEGEVSRAKDNLLAFYEKAANGASTRKNPEFIRPIINNFFEGYPYMDPAMEYEIVKQICSQLSAPVLGQVVAQLITDDNQVILYKGPEKEGIATPSKEQVLAVLQEVKAADIQANAEEVTTEPLLDPSALKGSKVKKTSSSIYGSTEWTLANGVKVVVLPTEYKKDQILFNIYKAGGKSLVPTEDLATFDDNIISLFQRNSGLSKFKGTTLTKMLSGKNVDMTPYIGSLYNGVSGSSSVKDLETAFQLLYLCWADPRFDQEEFDQGITQLRSFLPNFVKQPNYKLQVEAMKTLYGDNPRVRVIDEATLDEAGLEVLERNYRNLFKDAVGAVMVIVGDVDLSVVKPLVEKYVGSLPKGKKPLSWVNHHTDILPGMRENVFTADMETPLTTVFQVYDDKSRPYTVADEVNLSAVSYILDMIYTSTLREEEGGTYGASAVDESQREPDPEYMLQVVFQAKPALADKLRSLAVEGFRRLAEEGPTAEETSRAIENFKKNIPESRIRNNYWQSDIISHYKFGYDRDAEWEAAVNAMSAETIQAAAKALFNAGNFVEVVMKPGNTTEKE